MRRLLGVLFGMVVRESNMGKSGRGYFSSSLFSIHFFNDFVGRLTADFLGATH